MLRNSNINANPNIVAAIEGLFDEDRQFELDERRLSIRESFSRPVKIQLSDRDEVYDGFSKNVSFEGIGIISRTRFEIGTEASVIILSSRANNPVFVSKLAWSKPFGEGWHVSGWKFKMLVRGQESGQFLE